MSEIRSLLGQNNSPLGIYVYMFVLGMYTYMFVLQSLLLELILGGEDNTLVELPKLGLTLFG